MESDGELVHLTVGGDLAAFEKLIHRYERSVRSVARAFLADSHVCEDATQETFVAAFRSVSSLRQRDKFGPWLMQIARRVAGRLQQHARRPLPTDDIEREAPAGGVNPQSQWLLSLIERLPEQERLVITRRYIYENENQRDVITALRTLHESVEAIKLPVREFEGVRCPGFRIEERDSTLVVWVDPATRLPRHAERSYAKTLAADDGDVREIVETYHDMKFDEPLADELFALTPPPGYEHRLRFEWRLPSDAQKPPK